MKHSIQRIKSLIQSDLANATRDSMVLYILAAPILLATIMAFLLPALGKAELHFAADQNNPAIQVLLPELERFGQVEALESANAVERRVHQSDHVAGIIADDDGRASILLQGNEGPEAAALMQAVLYTAANGPEAQYQTERQTGTRSGLADYARVILGMLSVLIGGIAAAFALIDEKENKVTRSYSVSPLRGFEYFFSRGLWAFAVSIFGTLAAHLILGPAGLSWGRLLLVILASSTFPLAICLLVGGIAANQIQAVAALKLVMFVFLTLPLVSLFIPQKLEFLLWILPNFWLFKAFEGIYTVNDGAFLLNALLCAVSGLAASLLLAAALAPTLTPGHKRKANKVITA
ncbi:MAG: ABC transporter permease [Spirochaetes bacterium]|nr:ABC transporter permease [Spirochaetota bacterium]MBU0956506.1 ABC transporter permease [Spirochaetota bacterium]